MLLKRFIIKTTTKVILFTFLLIVIAAISPAMRTVINNELALTQMQASNETYTLFNTYQTLRPILTIAFVGVAIWCIVSVALDIYNFVKDYTSKNK